MKNLVEWAAEGLKAVGYIWLGVMFLLWQLTMLSSFVDIVIAQGEAVLAAGKDTGILGWFPVAWFLTFVSFSMWLIFRGFWKLYGVLVKDLSPKQSRDSIDSHCEDAPYRSCPDGQDKKPS